MKKIALFNHKGGVGKTTLTVNIADAFVEMGHSVLLVDADPQCNLTSFYLEEADLEALLGKSDDNGAGETLWSAVKPVAEGRGGIIQIPEIGVAGKKICFFSPVTYCCPSMKRYCRKHGLNVSHVERAAMT